MTILFRSKIPHGNLYIHHVATNDDVRMLPIFFSITYFIIGNPVPEKKEKNNINILS